MSKASDCRVLCSVQPGCLSPGRDAWRVTVDTRWRPCWGPGLVALPASRVASGAKARGRMEQSLKGQLGWTNWRGIRRAVTVCAGVSVQRQTVARGSKGWMSRVGGSERRDSTKNSVF